MILREETIDQSNLLTLHFNQVLQDNLTKILIFLEPKEATQKPFKDLLLLTKILEKEIKKLLLDQMFLEMMMQPRKWQMANYIMQLALEMKPNGRVTSSPHQNWIHQLEKS